MDAVRLDPEQVDVRQIGRSLADRLRAITAPGEHEPHPVPALCRESSGVHDLLESLLQPMLPAWSTTFAVPHPKRARVSAS